MTKALTGNINRAVQKSTPYHNYHDHRYHRLHLDNCPNLDHPLYMDHTLYVDHQRHRHHHHHRTFVVFSIGYLNRLLHHHHSPRPLHLWAT